MAVALLVIGWVTLFSAEFHRSGERPGTFLLALIHPLADLAVLGALLPMVTTAWRRVMLPYLALVAVLVGDALAVGQRALGGHPGVAAQLLALLGALLLGAAPWRVAETSWTRRTSSSAAATIIAALAAAVATVVVIASGLAGAPASGAALVVAGGAGVLVLAVRVFMLVNQNGVILGIWRESSRSLRELASRTSDVVLVCDLEGVISYASPAVGDYGYAPGDLAGRRLLDFVHPEDRGAVLTASRLALGAAPGRPPTAARPAPPGGSRPGCGPPTVRGGTSSPPCCRTRSRARRGPDHGHRARRQRPGGAPPAGRAPDLPRRADRPAQPGLRRGADPGPAARRHDGPPGRRHLPRPGPLHRGQRLGWPRRRRPRARPGRPPPARHRPGPRHGRALGQ